uniref:RRM domain-containing protein n=1 Tax=Macrostomum lignano TaxID=282301 RepID=A0A1I8FNA9_9PLAT
PLSTATTTAVAAATRTRRARPVSSCTACRWPEPTDTAGNEFGKLFIGGLSQLTNETSLRCHFGMYGQVEDAVVMMDSQTGRSRGFGFVKIPRPRLDAVLETSDHVIDGKAVDVKQSNIQRKSSRSLKIFVGGIAPEHDSATTKQRHRGFAFVAFDDERVPALVQLHYVDICGRLVEVKAMKPPNSTPPLLPARGKRRPLRRLLQRLQRPPPAYQQQQQQQQQQLYQAAQPYHLMQPHQAAAATAAAAPSTSLP